MSFAHTHIAHVVLHRIKCERVQHNRAQIEFLIWFVADAIITHQMELTFEFDCDAFAVGKHTHTPMNIYKLR